MQIECRKFERKSTGEDIYLYTYPVFRPNGKEVRGSWCMVESKTDLSDEEVKPLLDKEFIKYKKALRIEIENVPEEMTDDELYEIVKSKSIK